jgi:hypothetical protein
MAGITLAIGFRDARYLARRAALGVKDVAHIGRPIAHSSAAFCVSLVV